jgi:hypothetical protein
VKGNGFGVGWACRTTRRTCISVFFRVLPWLADFGVKKRRFFLSAFRHVRDPPLGFRRILLSVSLMTIVEMHLVERIEV